MVNSLLESELVLDDQGDYRKVLRTGAFLFFIKYENNIIRNG